ncbi:MAG: DUF177 domain-containing protein [Chloroflexi bacterium]|nr:DUF177 domain-containing protein [Chloroflexota bacterium]
MRVNVAQLLKGTVGDTRRYDIDETIEEGLPVVGEAKLVLTNRSILVTGAFKTIIHSTCSRCLKEFENPLEFTIEEEFFPTGDILNVPAPPVEPEEKADGFVIGEDHVLDLSEALRQNLLLSIPTKPVCQPRCAGLCPYCGHDLNKGPCGCAEEQLDPRWSPLRQLLSDQTVKR